MTTGDYEPEGPSVPGSALSPDSKGISSHFFGGLSLIPLNLAEHTHGLYLNLSQPQHAHIWKWMFWGLFPSFEEFKANLEDIPKGHVPYAIMSSGPNHLSNQKPGHEAGTVTAVGHVYLERISERDRCIDVGSIIVTPTAQRTPVITEAVYLSKALF